MNTGFSVLMSLYIKEKKEYARECFESLLHQTVCADEWVIVEDGPLTQELYDLLDEYEAKYPGLIKRVPLKVNRGLGLALREGVLHCSNELIARMDTDDIARKDRFEKQIALFESDPKLDICGSHIKEFYDDHGSPTAIRKVPITEKEIIKYQKRRDGFNHVTVMFKKSAVIKAGNYQHALLMEDSLLWTNMFLSGAHGCNIDDYLVFVRTGKAMYQRRGSLAYFRKYRDGRKQILATGFISYWDYFVTVSVQFVFSIIPGKLRQFLFEKILRN